MSKFSLGILTCVAAMVYWTRKRAGISDLSVWGIVTDSIVWTFLHMHQNLTLDSYSSQGFGHIGTRTLLGVYKIKILALFSSSHFLFLFLVEDFLERFMGWLIKLKIQIR